MQIALLVMLLGCGDKLEDTSVDESTEQSETTTENEAEEVEEVENESDGLLSDCGQTVLTEGDSNAFDQCFIAIDTSQYGSCETCGYYDEVSMSQGDYDCITCPESFEIDVAFDDCTGYCVPEGTATATVQNSGCTPVSECVLD
jgi:hypothetical protein